MKTRTFSTTIGLTAMLAATLPFHASAAPTTTRASIPTPQPQLQLPVAPSVAPGYTAPDVQPSPGQLVGVTEQPFVGIGLRDAIGMALLKNPDLAVAASNTRIAAYEIRAAKGAFDVRFMVDPSVKHDVNAATNAFFAGGTDFQPIVQNYQTIEGGLQGQLPGGQQYNVNVTQTKVNDNTYIDAFNPYYLASFNVSLTQPLLKNSGINQLDKNLQLSIVNADVSRSQTLTSVSTTISNVADSYWDLVSAWRAVAIDEDALHQAMLQQASNVRLAKQGQAAPIDAVDSATQVATSRQQVFQDLQQVSIEQNNLKSLIVDDPADPIWRANLVPTSSVLHLPSVPSYDALLATAMQNRPEVRQIADTLKQSTINLKYAKNQLLPQADVQLNYESNGFAGNALPPLGSFFGTATPPPYLVGGYPQAYTNAWAGKFPTYSFGVLISLPLGNNTARADLAAAREQERQAGIQGSEIRQRIAFDVRNALQAYQTALASLYAARQAREDAAQVYASEQRKFRNGVSTTFLVLQRQVSYVQAEGRELQAQTALNKAVVELQRVDGSILTVNDVEIKMLGTGTGANQ